MTRYVKLFVVVSLLSVSSTSFAWQKLDRNLDIECIQSSNRLNINCDYRLINTGQLVDLQAEYGKQSLPLSGSQSWPWENAKSAILFLIDTSDPARQAVIDKKISHIEKLLPSIDSNQHQIGIATFDKELTLLNPPGSTQDEMLASIRQIRAEGKTTELYRNLLNAIDVLSRTQADRKVIFLLSDGLAEDKAYFHSDVIDRALSNNIVINSLGYPRSVSLSVALQIIRRLSEETGGQYVEVDPQYNLPQNFLDNPLSSIADGGRFSINLSQISFDKVNENADMVLKFTTTEGNIGITLPVQAPAIKKATIPETVSKVANPAVISGTENSAKPEPVTEPESVKAEVKQPVVTTSAPASFSSRLDKWFLYGIPIALVVLLLLTIASLIISFIRPREKQLPQVTIGDIKPFAYLVMQDETKRRYPITRTTWRIGRSKDNELSLDDNSISRRHAEIHRSQGDEFTIIDLDSLNGVFINNEKIKIHSLKEGDIVEIGDINFRFSLLSAEYPMEESTVMQKTKTPAYTH